MIVPEDSKVTWVKTDGNAGADDYTAGTNNTTVHDGEVTFNVDLYKYISTPMEVLVESRDAGAAERYYLTFAG